MLSIPMGYRRGRLRQDDLFEKFRFGGLRRETSYRPVDRGGPRFLSVKIQITV